MTRYSLLLMGLLVGSAIGQTKPDYLPHSCKVGDVTDSYDGHWEMCAKKDVWSALKSPPVELYNQLAMDGTFPDCRLAFIDADGGEHCPWETATGRVVACEPCRKTSTSCTRWYADCLKLVDLMKRYETSEPIYSTSETRTDHTQPGTYTCPDGLTVKWYTKKEIGQAPICINFPAEKIDCPNADTRKPSKTPEAGDLEQLDQWRYRFYDGEEWIEHDSRNDIGDQLNMTMPVTVGHVIPDHFSGGVEEIPATMETAPGTFGDVGSPLKFPTCPKSGTWFLEQATNGKSFCRKVQGQ